jgi:lipoyl(octanoyl) transferase
LSHPIEVWRLGRVEYEDGLQLQKLFGQARAQDLIGDVLLLLEHSPVLTLGRAGKRHNVLVDDDVLARMGVELFDTNRGGDVTYHGPGQVVGYPIFKLAGNRQDVRRYVRDLEEAMIRTASRFGITAGRIPKWTGVWIGAQDAPDARKLAAIGVHISRWQTSHGFALNVNTDLSHFGLIVPCGIREAGVTSLAAELGRKVPLVEVEDALAHSFAEIFGGTLVERGPALRTISCAVVRGEGHDQEILLLRRTPERGGFWQIVTGRRELGEGAPEAAAREVHEETGQPLPVRALDYQHSFAVGEHLPPRVLEETAFAARWPQGAEVRIDPAEHTAFEWVSVPEALARLPFKGLKVAVSRATSAAVK